MKTVTLYWSNICLLRKQEIKFLEEAKERLLSQGVSLEIKFFGIGYTSTMADYLREEDAKIPDIIVSTDLEVFEDERVFSKFEDQLYPISDWVKIKTNEGIPDIYRGKGLLSYLAIPLVFYTSEQEKYNDVRLQDLIRQGVGITFGGINNSAVKTVVKAVWSHYGKEMASRLLSSGDVTNMPIEAFQKVRTGAHELALVPAIFAMRADEKERFARVPLDGALAVPSYMSALKSIDEETARLVVAELTRPESCEFYVKDGDFICGIDGTSEQKWLSDKEYGLQIPDLDWLASTSSEEFHEFYCDKIKTARTP